MSLRFDWIQSSAVVVESGHFDSKINERRIITSFAPLDRSISNFRCAFSRIMAWIGRIVIPRLPMTSWVSTKRGGACR